MGHGGWGVNALDGREEGVARVEVGRRRRIRLDLELAAAVGKDLGGEEGRAQGRHRAGKRQGTAEMDEMVAFAPATAICDGSGCSGCSGNSGSGSSSSSGGGSSSGSCSGSSSGSGGGSAVVGGGREVHRRGA